MTLEFTVTLAHRPGALAEMGFVLEEAGVNIEAIHAIAIDGKGIVSFVVNDPSAAAATLERAGISHQTREVVVVNVLNKPGSLAEVALVMADAGINIEALYITIEQNVVLVVDDVAGAIEVAQGMAVRKR